MGRGGDGGAAIIGGGVCCCVTLIVTIVLLAVSWSVLEPTEWGLKFNGITMTMDDSEVYTSGRIYVGVGGSFYRFPRSLTYVEFSSAKRNALDVWSQDGQQIFVECSFYYALRGDKIHDIFYTYGQDIGTVVTYMAAETIRNVATAYTTLDFFTNRSAIDAEMQVRLSARLNADAFSTIEQFNLLGIDVPDAFDSAIINKVITGQDVLTLEQLRQSQVIRSQITIVNATAAANVTTLNANAAATGLIVTQTTAANNFLTLQSARAAELLRLFRGLNFTTADQILQYMHTEVVRGAAVAKTTLAVDVSGSSVRM